MKLAALEHGKIIDSAEPRWLMPRSANLRQCCVKYAACHAREVLRLLAAISALPDAATLPFRQENLRLAVHDFATHLRSIQASAFPSRLG